MYIGHWLCSALAVTSLMLILASPAVADDLTSAQMRIYFGESMESTHRPEDTPKFRLHDINLVKQNDTLKNIGPIYPMTKYIYAVKNSQTVDEDLNQKIADRLLQGGVAVSTEEEMENIPGNPELQFYLSVFENQDCCYITLWMSLLQTVALTRNLNIHKKVGTWGTGERYECSSGRKNGDVSTIVLAAIDTFVSSHQEINSNQINGD